MDGKHVKHFNRNFHLSKYDLLQLSNFSRPPRRRNTSVGVNKEREINTKPSTVGSDGALL